MKKKKLAENEQFNNRIAEDEKAALEVMFQRKQDMKVYIDGLLGQANDYSKKKQL